MLPRDLLVRHERTLHSPEQVAAAIRRLQGNEPDAPSPSVSNITGDFIDSHILTLILAKNTPSNTSGSGDEAKDEIIVTRKKPSLTASNKVKKTTEKSSINESAGPSQSANSTGMAIDHSTFATIEANSATVEGVPAMGVHLADFNMDVSDLEKMRTFPSSVPLPDLDGDLEFLDFFDPFLGLPPKQVEAFALPPLNTDGWSPLENFSGSSQASMQDYGFQQTQLLSTHESPSLDDASQPWGVVAPMPSQPHQTSITWDERLSPQFTAAHPEIEALPSLSVPQPKISKQPPLVFTESMRAHLLKDLSNRLSAEQLGNYRLPTASALQKCIRTYVDAFHVHLPIFHLQTMNFETAPSPLILAICAIGAQYRLERKISASLYLKADQGLAAAVVDRGDHLHKKPRLLEDWVRPQSRAIKSTPEALWKSQTRLLLAMLSCFSGDTEVISKAIVHLGDFLMVLLFSSTGTHELIFDRTFVSLRRL